MEKYWQIEKVNLKYHVPLHVLECILILGISPLLLGVSNLPAEDTAKVLERYVALTGIILITPIFLPEQDKNIRELVNSKYTKSSAVYLVRLAGNLCLLAALLGIYIGMLKHNNCQFPVIKYYLGTFAEMLFFGGLGIIFYRLSDNLIIGYMAPIIYYIIASGGGEKYMGILYPFSMSMGSYTEKIWLFAAAACLIGDGVFLKIPRPRLKTGCP